jgi:hypothetical protein
MLKTYEFRDPTTERRIELDKLSYLWAGLLGPIYVAFKAGPLSVFFSLLYSLSCVAALLMLLVNLNRVPAAVQLVVLIFGVLGVLLFHSMRTIGLVVSYYRKARWRVRSR